VFENQSTEDGYVDLYVDYKPRSVFGWIETCEVDQEDGICTTVDLEPGLEYRIYDFAEYEVTFIFENDTPFE